MPFPSCLPLNFCKLLCSLIPTRLKYYTRDTGLIINQGFNLEFIIELTNSGVIRNLVEHDVGIALAWDYSILNSFPDQNVVFRPLQYKGWGSDISLIFPTREKPRIKIWRFLSNSCWTGFNRSIDRNGLRWRAVVSHWQHGIFCGGCCFSAAPGGVFCFHVSDLQKNEWSEVDLDYQFMKS